jgi:hypothetical protein
MASNTTKRPVGSSISTRSCSSPHTVGSRRYVTSCVTNQPNRAGSEDKSVAGRSTHLCTRSSSRSSGCRVIASHNARNAVLRSLDPTPSAKSNVQRSRSGQRSELERKTTARDGSVTWREDAKVDEPRIDGRRSEREHRKDRLRRYPQARQPCRRQITSGCLRQITSGCLHFATVASSSTSSST